MARLPLSIQMTVGATLVERDLQFPSPDNVSCCETMWQKVSRAVMAQQCFSAPPHSPPGACPEPTSDVAFVACGWLILRTTGCAAHVALEINISLFAEWSELLCRLTVWAHKRRLWQTGSVRYMSLEQQIRMHIYVYPQVRFQQIRIIQGSFLLKKADLSSLHQSPWRLG